MSVDLHEIGLGKVAEEYLEISRHIFVGQEYDGKWYACRYDENAESEPPFKHRSYLIVIHWALQQPTNKDRDKRKREREALKKLP